MQSQLPVMAEHPMSQELVKIGVMGGGAWGTALALHCGRKGHEVLVWAREVEVVESINTAHENKAFFPGFALPEQVKASGEIAEVAKFGELLLLVVPTPFVETTINQVKDIIRSDQARLLHSWHDMLSRHEIKEPETFLCCLHADHLQLHQGDFERGAALGSCLG